MKRLVTTGLMGCVLGAWIGVHGAGCTVSSETTDPVGWPYPDAASFCAKLGEMVCNDQVVRGCYGSDDASLPANTASCVESFQANANCASWPTYHPEQADGCLAAWQTAYEDSTLYPEDLEDIEEACLPTFHDDGAAGDVCTQDGDCDQASDLSCVVKAGADSGTCQVPDNVGGGEHCDALNAVCPSTQYCNEQGNCIVRPGPGEACTPEMPCVESALCGIDTPDLCGSKRQNNDPCTADEQCVGGMCDLVSGATDGVCASSISLYQQGELCDVFQSG